MANKTLFSTNRATRTPAATTRNKAGGRAYKVSDAEALCKYAVTSTLGDAYYVSAKDQLDDIKRLCDTVEPEIIAKAAVYGAEKGKMKDMPAYFCAVLAAKREIDLLRKVFPRVIKSPKMLLNFVQIIRSGVTGRRSFGSAIKNMIRDWIVSRRGNRLFLASIGYRDPSLADVIKMVHPRPANEEQSALFAYLIGKPYEAEALPPLTKEFLAFKEDNTNPLPDMDYRSLTNCNLTDAHWLEIAGNMPWNTVRMNLNLLGRHNVFANDEAVRKIATKIADPQQVRQWNAFPYQLMTTFQNIDHSVPQKIQLALQDAMEIATENVPKLGENVAVLVDCSGSMCSPVTGRRPGGVETKTQCIDVGALMASSILRTNPEASVIAFACTAKQMHLNPRDSVMTNSRKLRDSRVGYSTNISLAMDKVVRNPKPFDFVVCVGDSQSWADSVMAGSRGSGLATLWEKYKGRNKKAKLAEIVVGPYTDRLTPTTDPRCLNVGGFSDAVFDVLGEFSERDGNVSFLDVIKRVEL